MNNSVRTAILLGAMTGLILATGAWIGGRSGMAIALVIAGAVNFVSYWFSDRIVLRMYGAREVSAKDQPGLHAAVSALSNAAKIPMPRLFLIESDTPNAFATGRNPRHAAVAITHGLLALCDSAELEGVVAHEISHVRNRDILVSSIAAALAGAVMVSASVLRWDLLLGGGQREGGRGPLATLALIILAPIAAGLIQLGISRAREYEADAAGARITGAPLALACALRKLAGFNALAPLAAEPSTAHLFIVNPISAGSMARLFSTHPPLEDRIRRLEEMDRPAAAARGR